MENELLEQLKKANENIETMTKDMSTLKKIMLTLFILFWIDQIAIFFVFLSTLV